MYNYTVYAYWNQDQLYALFNGIVMIMNGGGDYLTLMKALAIVGLIASGVAALAKMRAEGFASYFIMTAMLFGCLVLPKATITIVDAAGGYAPKVVANVPWGLGAMASITSHVGYWLTKSYETALSVPDDLSFQKNGFLFGAKLLTARQKVETQDPQLRTDMLSWFKDCLAYEIIDNPARLNEIRTSNNLWATIDAGHYMNPGRVVSIYRADTGQVEYVDCKAAFGELNLRLTEDEKLNIKPSLQKYLYGNNTTDASNAIVLADQAMLHATATGAADVIRQAVMLNLFRDGPSSIAAVTNNPTMAAIEIAKIQAAHQANSSYEVMRSISESALPLVRNAIHTIIIAAFPIVLLMIIMGGDKGPGIFVTYVSMLMFVELWAPLFAVVNHLLTYASMKDVSKVIDGGGINLSNYEIVSKGLISAQGVAGMLTMSIPVIAYALVSKSQQAAANLSSGVTAPGQAAASSAGSQAAMGNMPEWGNVNTYQQKSAASWESGAARQTAIGSDGSKITTFGDGSQTLDRSGTQSNLGAYTMGLTSTASTQNQEASTRSYTSSASSAATSAKSMNAALTAFKSHENDFNRSNGVNVATGTGSGVNISKALDSINSATNEATNGQNFTKEESAAITATAAAGVGKGFGVANIRAGLEAQGVRQEKLSSAIAATQKLGNSDSFKTGVSQLDDVSQKISATNGSGHQEAWAEGIKKDFAQSKTSAQTSTEQLSAAKGYDETASKTGKGDASVGQRLEQAWVNSHGGAEGALSYIKNHSDAEVKQDMSNFTLSSAAKEAIHDSNFTDQSGGNKNLVAATSNLTPPTNSADLVAQGNANEASVVAADNDNAKHVPSGANQTPTATATTPMGNKGAGGHVDGSSYTVTPASVTDAFKNEGRNAYLPAEATRIAGEVASGDDAAHDKLLDKGQSGALMSGAAGVSKAETVTPPVPSPTGGWDTLSQHIHDADKKKD